MTTARRYWKLAPFNSPLECGLRSLVLLSEVHPSSSDLQRLVYYDYAIVHSEDAGGPPSLHPATPHRSGELLVRRELIEEGLLLMCSRALIERIFTASGIEYRATQSSEPFLECLRSKYISSLRGRAVWVVDTFGSHSASKLRQFFTNHLDTWGSEFVITASDEEEVR
jgi:hypothetical protein